MCQHCGQQFDGLGAFALVTVGFILGVVFMFSL